MLIGSTTHGEQDTRRCPVNEERAEWWKHTHYVAENRTNQPQEVFNINTSFVYSFLFIRDIQELNKIVLQKDTVVQGLQDQVVNFLDHDYNVLQVCPLSSTIDK